MLRPVARRTYGFVPAPPVTATAAPVLGTIIAASTATQTDGATAAPILGTLLAASTATQTDGATAAPILGTLLAASTATQTDGATGAPIPGAITAASTATQTDAATAAPVLGAITAASTATQTDAATAAPVLGTIIAASTATPTDGAIAVPVFGPVTAASTATQTNSAAAAPILGTLLAASTTTQTNPTTAAPTLGAITAASTAPPIITAAAPVFGPVRAAGTAVLQIGVPAHGPGYLNLSLHSKASRLAQMLTDIDTGGATVMSFYAGVPPATPEDLPAGPLLATLPCSAPFGAISNAIGTPVVTAAGSGYTSIPVFALAGATGGTGAVFQVVMQLATLGLGAGGGGYSVGDLIVLPAPGPTCLDSTVLAVTSIAPDGALTGVSIRKAGRFVGALPNVPVAEFENSGVGEGAIFNFATYSVARVQTIAPGLNYTSAGESGTALFTSGGGSGAAAAPRLTPILAAGPVTTANAVASGTVGMARISNGGGLVLTLVSLGSGGTDGTFPLDVTGGAGSGFAGSFTVVGGQVAALQVTNQGNYTVAPTISPSGSVGLIGASIAASLGAGVMDLDVGLAGSGASVIVNTMTVATGGPFMVSAAFIAEA